MAYIEVSEENVERAAGTRTTAATGSFSALAALMYMITGILMIQKMDGSSDRTWMAVFGPVIAYSVVVSLAPCGAQVQDEDGQPKSPEPGQALCACIVAGIFSILPTVYFAAWLDSPDTVDVAGWTWILWLSASLLALAGLFLVLASISTLPIATPVGATILTFGVCSLVFLVRLQPFLNGRSHVDRTSADIFLPIQVGFGVVAGVASLYGVIFLLGGIVTPLAFACWAGGGLAASLMLPVYLDDPTEENEKLPGQSLLVYAGTMALYAVLAGGNTVVRRR